MKLKLTQLNLADKLTTLTLLLTFISSFSILAMVYFFIIRINTSYTEKELKSTQVIIEHIYKEPMWNFDQNLINQLSDSLLADEGYAQIKALKITDNKNNVLYSKSKDHHETFSAKALKDHTHDHLSSVKLVKDNQEIGTVEFILSNVIGQSVFLSSIFNNLYVDIQDFISSSLQKRS